MTEKTVREYLAGLFGAPFNKVYSYAPVDPTYSPVLCVYNADPEFEFITKDLNTNLYSYFLEIMIKRAGGVDTEDSLDTCTDYVRDICRANVGVAGTWDNLEIVSVRTGFAETSGNSYRVREFRVIIKVIV